MATSELDNPFCQSCANNTVKHTQHTYSQRSPREKSVGFTIRNQNNQWEPLDSGKFVCILVEYLEVLVVRHVKYSELIIPKQYYMAMMVYTSVTHS